MKHGEPEGNVMEGKAALERMVEKEKPGKEDMMAEMHGMMKEMMGKMDEMMGMMGGAKGKDVL